MIAVNLKMGVVGSAIGLLFLTACGTNEPAARQSAVSGESAPVVEASATMPPASPIVGYWELDMATTVTDFEAKIAEMLEGDSKDETVADFEMIKRLFEGVEQHYSVNRDGSVLVQTSKAEDESFELPASSGSWEQLGDGELRVLSPNRSFRATLDGDTLTLKRIDKEIAPVWILHRVPVQK